ncbi:MAG: hypothetical protein M3R47_11640, partial [Chloroflexota bacterium]|nr:hypothetical protein [Chloroflexota bacterium]
MPDIAIHLLASLRLMLSTPNTIPMTAGTTKSNALNIFSVVRDIPESEDSNNVINTWIQVTSAT